MNTQMHTGEDVLTLVNQLASTNNEIRIKAIKALVAIDDAKSIPALVIALEDVESEVVWLAAEFSVNIEL